MFQHHGLRWEREEGLAPLICDLIVGINILNFIPPPPPPPSPQSPNQNKNEHPHPVTSHPPAMTTTTTKTAAKHPRSEPPVEPVWRCTLDAAGGMIVSKGRIPEQDRCVAWSSPSTFCLPDIIGRFTFLTTTTELNPNLYKLLISDDYISLTPRDGSSSSLGEVAPTTPRSYYPLLGDDGNHHHDPRDDSNMVGRNVVVVTSNNNDHQHDPTTKEQDVSALQVSCAASSSRALAHKSLTALLLSLAE
jgi:hypothetical protein